MPCPARAPALAVVTLLACSFDATGLGDAVGGSPAPGLTGVTRGPARATDAPGSSTGDEEHRGMCNKPCPGPGDFCFQGGCAH